MLVDVGTVPNAYDFQATISSPAQLVTPAASHSLQARTLSCDTALGDATTTAKRVKYTTSTTEMTTSSINPMLVLQYCELLQQLQASQMQQGGDESE